MVKSKPDRRDWVDRGCCLIAGLPIVGGAIGGAIFAARLVEGGVFANLLGFFGAIIGAIVGAVGALFTTYPLFLMETRSDDPKREQDHRPC
jgi:energy-converting hydrogenase Eha subunit A